MQLRIVLNESHFLDFVEDSDCREFDHFWSPSLKVTQVDKYYSMIRMPLPKFVNDTHFWHVVGRFLSHYDLTLNLGTFGSDSDSQKVPMRSGIFGNNTHFRDFGEDSCGALIMT